MNRSDPDPLPLIETLRTQLKLELDSILHYWSTETIDTTFGGFFGEINYANEKNPKAEKGSVLNARILWSFSAAYPITQNENHKLLAKRAFDYLVHHFYDHENGGIFWSIYHDGTPKDTKNQIYALAFTIYGLAEYYKISDDKNALTLAIALYHKIQLHSLDVMYNGYFEAFTQDWTLLDDLRLSEKDANEKKTMNTHLHIVEAYANLYTIWPDQNLKAAITNLLELIDCHFINKVNGHLRLFFDENWNENQDVISYGHDIEAAWLLLWCAERIEDQHWILKYQENAILLTNAAARGLDEDGGLWYELEIQTQKRIEEKHWWPQAEWLIGMVNAYQITRDTAYLELAEKNLEFIQKHLIDDKQGEWFWGIDKNYEKIKKDKAGFWKCPYHNSRACIEILNRLSS